jgi:hypothetical protein
LLDLNITFFPYEDAPVGVNGYGVSTRVYFSIPFDSVDYWVARLKGVGLNVGEPRLSIPLYGFKHSYHQPPYEQPRLSFNNHIPTTITSLTLA